MDENPSDGDLSQGSDGILWMHYSTPPLYPETDLPDVHSSNISTKALAIQSTLHQPPPNNSPKRAHNSDGVGIGIPGDGSNKRRRVTGPSPPEVASVATGSIPSMGSMLASSMGSIPFTADTLASQGPVDPYSPDVKAERYRIMKEMLAQKPSNSQTTSMDESDVSDSESERNLPGAWRRDEPTTPPSRGRAARGRAAGTRAGASSSTPSQTPTVDSATTLVSRATLPLDDTEPPSTSSLYPQIPRTPSRATNDRKPERIALHHSSERSTLPIPSTPQTNRVQRFDMTPEEREARRRRHAELIARGTEEVVPAMNGLLPIVPAPLPAPRSAPDVSPPRPPPSPTKNAAVQHRISTLPSRLTVVNGYAYIGYDPDVQSAMNAHNLSWAVQYEIARFRTILLKFCFSAEEYQPILRALQGTNTAARDVPNQIHKLLRSTTTKEENAQPPPLSQPSVLDEIKSKAALADRQGRDALEELDREEDDIVSGRYARLGLTDPHDDWYGGQVLQVASLIDYKAALKGVLGGSATSARMPRYTLRLEPHRVGRSHRVSRFYGSRRVIQVSIPQSTIRAPDNGLLEFFRQKFVLNGRVFQAVFAKEKSVYLLETGDLPGSPLSSIPNTGRHSLQEFIQWHNPMNFNRNQAVAKYTSRFALAFSTSVPVCRVKGENVFSLPDIVVSWQGSGKPPAKYVMTDGCGFMNVPAARIIQERFSMKVIPAAVQARFGGAKGMFMLHPNRDMNIVDEPMIWMRDSQKKIESGKSPSEQDDISQLTLDLIRTPRLKMPARLSKEVMACLSHGKVKTDVIEVLFREGLRAEYEALAAWEGGHATMLKLYDAVSAADHVPATRLRRLAFGAARAFGFGDDSDEVDREDGLSDEEDAFSDSSIPWNPDITSGMPSTLGETVMKLLEAGFQPATSALLREKLKVITKGVITRYVEKFHIGVPQSAEGFAIPDPLGILKEGEIYCRSSEPWQDDNGRWRDTVVGPVLATRHPCKVSSDIQKFQGVERPELRDYLDVVIFSTKGKRSPMSLLGGGDYDGDTVLLIWEHDIVNDFRPATDCPGDPPPNFEKDNFEKEVMSVAEFEASVSRIDEEKKSLEAQRHLLSALNNTSVVGQYSNLHEKAAYTFGYNHKDTVRLALMFCTCLDASKSGLTVRPEVLKRDRNLFGEYVLPSAIWLQKSSSEPSPFAIPKPLQRPSGLGPEIIEELVQIGRDVKELYFIDLDKKPQGNQKDAALAEPFYQVQAQAQKLSDSGEGTMKIELELIMRAVQQSQTDWKARTGRSLTNLTIVERQDILRELSAEFWASVDYNYTALPKFAVPTIAASYAYVHDYTLASYTTSRFPFGVAFRELLHIKARKTGMSSTITFPFAERFVLHRASLNLL